ncbi:MAG: glycosyltransferase [Verrucomicrobiota bacterium]|nr:glycosyltransferase [Verrucomicrobiota bacterium]
MKVCDLTQFYAPRSGGVKRYLHEKIAFVQKHRPDDEHVLIVPGAQDTVTPGERSRIYSIASPLVSSATGYRVLLNLRAVDEIIERERPDIIETSDPYQLGWKTLRTSALHAIPAVAFYHSHFAEAYFRAPAERFGTRAADALMHGARAYVRNLYNQFAATLVASDTMRDLLEQWGVTNARHVGLGVDIDIFHPANDRDATRSSIGVSPNERLLLYVGRLTGEKNTQTLFDAFEMLTQRSAGFRLLVVGDGPEQARVHELTGVTWLPYVSEPAQLATFYRAADLFVHPGVKETFGLAALESQACGTPVVGIRGTRMDEVILHDQSDWADENTAPALAAAIERMSARTDLNGLGLSASNEVAARYAWTQVFERLFSIYAEVVERYRT